MKASWKIFTKLRLVLTIILFTSLNAFSQEFADCDKGVDISQYKTYDFRPGTSYYQGKREKHNLKLEQKINNSVAQELNDRGLMQSSVNPDLIITYTYGVEEVKQVEIKAPMYAGPVINTSEGLWAGSWTNWWVTSSDIGTLMIDMRENNTNKLVNRVYGMGDVKRPRKQQKEFDRITKMGFKCLHG